MKVFIEYYEKCTYCWHCHMGKPHSIKECSKGRWVNPCGDRAVVQLDGRNSLATWHTDAKRINGQGRPKYQAYKLLRGERLSDARPITGLIELKDCLN